MEIYDYTTNASYLEYEFISNGPKGRITKVVRYTKSKLNGAVFNLGFGDENEETGFVDDLTISNNNDRDKILATVARTVLDFISHYPDCYIGAMGSTPSRTRLYQMAIAANFAEISKLFYIYGLVNKKWELFRKNVNYDAFLVEPK